MSTSKNLRGFTPAKKRGNNANSTGNSIYAIASGDARNIFNGDLVKVSAGLIEVVSASDDFAVGVFTGVSYEQDGEPKFAQHWTASTSASNIKAYVDDDIRSTYFIQADASVSIGDINVKNFGVTLGAGSTVTHQSGFGVKAATRTDKPEMLKVIGVKSETGNVTSTHLYLLTLLLCQSARKKEIKNGCY
jgi:hypothetical protein